VNRFLNWLGYFAFFGIIFYFLSLHGREWEFGRYFMPRSLVNETGVEFRNGAKIDGATLALIKAGKEEEMYLAIGGIVLSVIAVYGMLIYRDHRRHQKRIAEMWNLYR
jgi:hypothetical protein